MSGAKRAGYGPLHVEQLGSGPPLVLLHGLGSSHVHWLSVGRRFAKSHRVVIPDLPGFGLTPLSGRSAHVEANAELLVRFVEGLGEPVRLAGNSMGSLISLIATERRPDLVQALVLVSPAAPAIVNARYEPRLAALFSAYTWPVVGELTRELWVRLQGPEGMVKTLFEMSSSAPDQVPPEVVDAAHRLASRRPHQDEVHAFLAAYRSTWLYLLNRWRFDALLRSITPPTLVVQGTADRLVPDAATARLRRVRPDWTFVRLEGAGHMPQLDQPGAFVTQVSGWLAANPARRAAG